MARIRTIKPEFPQSESMGRVSRDARLLFVQMWTLADDSGRLRGNSRMLASLLFPYDDDAPGLISGWLDELEREKCIERYSGDDGSSYVSICNWLDHQKIDKPSESKLPPPNLDAIREDSRTLSNPLESSIPSRARADQGPRTKDQGSRKGEEGSNPLSLSKHFLAEDFKKAWHLWLQKQRHERHGVPVDAATEEASLYELESFPTDEAIAIVRYSTSRTNCKNLITNGDHRKKPQTKEGGKNLI